MSVRFVSSDELINGAETGTGFMVVTLRAGTKILVQIRKIEMIVPIGEDESKISFGGDETVICAHPLHEILYYIREEAGR